jgi:hypothetical protein
MKRLAASLILLAACTTTPTPPPQALSVAPAAPQAAVAEKSTIESKTAKLQKFDGFVPLFWDAENGKLFMQLSRLNEELLYQVSLPGVGSNPIGLDRGLLGQTQIVTFERIGPKVLMTATNTRFRALSNDEAERRAVAGSFARSVLWSFKVEASDGNSVLVDATDFFLSDQQSVTRTLRNTQQGNYALDKNRSAIYLPRTKVFPRNTEVEAVLTFQTGERPDDVSLGSHLRSSLISSRVGITRAASLTCVSHTRKGTAARLARIRA